MAHLREISKYRLRRGQSPIGDPTGLHILKRFLCLPIDALDRYPATEHNGSTGGFHTSLHRWRHRKDEWPATRIYGASGRQPTPSPGQQPKWLPLSRQQRTESAPQIIQRMNVVLDNAVCRHRAIHIIITAVSMNENGIAVQFLMPPAENLIWFKLWMRMYVQRQLIRFRWKQTFWRIFALRESIQKQTFWEIDWFIRWNMHKFYA